METLKVDNILESEIVSAAIYEYSVAYSYDVGNFKFVSVRSCYSGSFVYENLYVSKEDLLSFALLFYISRFRGNPYFVLRCDKAKDLVSSIDKSEDINSLL